MSLSTNLVAYWKLDESSGNAADASGGGFTLTNTGSATYSAAKINNGVALGASNSTKWLGYNGSNMGITGRADQSFAGWVNITTAPPTDTNYSLFAKADSSTNNVWHSIEYGDASGVKKLFGSDFNYGAGGTVQTIVTQTLTTGTWYHLALTYDNSTGITTMYLNGSSIGTVTSSKGNGGLTVPDNGFNIGNFPNNSELASASFDEVGLWSRVLSAAEVTSLYNSGAGLAYPFANSYTQTLTESSSFTATLSKAATRILSQSVTYTDTFARVLTAVRTLTESATNTASVVKTTGRTLIDSITDSDTFLGLRTKASTLSDTVTYAASVIRTVSRLLTESSTMSDTVTGFRNRVSTLIDTFSASDSIIRAIARPLVESLTYSDVMTTIKSLLRTLTDTTTATASLIKTAGRSLVESFTATDVFSRVFAAGLTFTEAVTFSAVFRLLKNGSATIWTNVQKNTASLTNTVKHPATLSTVLKNISTWRNKDKS